MANKEKNTLAPPDFGHLRVIGINSALADYRLVWLLNEKLSIKLARQDDLEQNDGIYPYYHCNSEGNAPSYGLLAVSYDKKSILNFKPRLDYLFIIRDNIRSAHIDSILEKIKNLNGVNYAFLMDGYMERLESTLYELENYDTTLVIRQRYRNSPEYAKEVIRQRNILLGLEQD